MWIKLSIRAQRMLTWPTFALTVRRHPFIPFVVMVYLLHVRVKLDAQIEGTTLNLSNAGTVLTGGLSRTRTGPATLFRWSLMFLPIAVMVNTLVLVEHTTPVYLIVLRLQVLVPIM